MLPESRIRSSGRMSAPVHEPASSSKSAAQDRYQVRLRLGAGTTAGVRRWTLSVVDIVVGGIWEIGGASHVRTARSKAPRTVRGDSIRERTLKRTISSVRPAAC